MIPTRDRSAGRRRVAIPVFVLGVLALLVAGLFVALAGRAAGPSDEEPFKFNHRRHLDAGLQCLFCHPGAINGAMAGLPSVQKCVGCHENITVRGARGQQQVVILLQHWEERTPIRWQKVNDLPDFVQFTHQPHIAAGVNCEECHGNVREMEVMHKAYRINMGFCLHCHRRQPAEKQETLLACVTCHH